MNMTLELVFGWEIKEIWQCVLLINGSHISELDVRLLNFSIRASASSLLVCLILFPSVGITVVQHCNTVGIHRSFPQGVV